MARFKFTTPTAHIVVSPSGYFDVFASVDHPSHERPAYRGELAELGRDVVDAEHLRFRPGSAAVRAAVDAWARQHGAEAIAGALGKGRQGAEEPAGKVDSKKG